MQMKRFLFIIIALIAISIKSTAEEQIPLLQINEEPDENDHPMHKAPADYGYLPTVIYDGSITTLSFSGNADLGLIPYTIMDEDENVVLSGHVNIQYGSTTNVSLSSIPEGCYILTIEVNGNGFAGVFII